MLFAVWDTETTGLPFHHKADLNRQPRAIEFGGIITDGKEILFEESFICNPGIAIEQIITDITGLTNEDLWDKPDFGTFVPRLKAYYAKADASITHNLSFDRFIMFCDLLRRGLTLEDIEYPKVQICTVEQTFQMYGRRMKLIELYQMHVKEYVQKHRALDDVYRLHELCQTLGVYESFMEEAA